MAESRNDLRILSKTDMIKRKNTAAHCAAERIAYVRAHAKRRNRIAAAKHPACPNPVCAALAYGTDKAGKPDTELDIIGNIRRGADLRGSRTGVGMAGKGTGNDGGGGTSRT